MTKQLEYLFDRDRMYLYPWYFADECLTFDIEKVFGKKVKEVILEFKKGHMFYYCDIESMDEIGKWLFEKSKKSKRFTAKVQLVVLKLSSSLLKFCQKIQRIDPQKLSNQSIFRLYKNYIRYLKKLRAWGWVPTLIDGMHNTYLTDYLLESFKEFLKTRKLEKRLSYYYGILSSAEKMSEVGQEELVRLRFLLEIQKKESQAIKLLKSKKVKRGKKEKILKERYKTIYQKIVYHSKKFAWLPYAFIGPQYHPSMVIRALQSDLMNKLSVQEQIKKIKNHFKNVNQQKKKIIKDLNLPKDLKFLFHLSSFYMHLKDFRKGIYQKSYVAMEPIMKEIAFRLNLTYDEARFISSEEIADGLSKNRNFRDVAKKRTEYCVARIKEGMTKIYEGKKAKSIVKKQVVIGIKKEKNIKEIKGMPAFAGRASGKVKIVVVAKDVSKMKEGDILVSPATNPDLILAMKKAAAIVTEMGGIVSHAAIVSRELEIPCVVGTKIATKVLKDGDLVEVDAAKGVVKKLK